MEGIGLSLRDDLEGRFEGMPYTDDTGSYWPRAKTFGEAEGLMFLCPTCYVRNSGSVGTHYVLCWSPNVSQEWNPTPGRWELVGTGLDDISLVADSSSVALQGGCGAHFFVTNGLIADKRLE